MRVIKLVILLLALAAISLQQVILNNGGNPFPASFCWKDSYGRGVGRIPDKCEGTRVRIGLLCYSACPSGFSRAGFDCHQNCLGGWENQGLFCRLKEYGRGGGYPWNFWDGFSDGGMYNRCQRDHGNGNCEKWGAIVYPKCRAGFYAFGCCICRPYTPNCVGLGYAGQFDLSCSKRIIIGDPVSAVCSVANEEKSAALCYPKCKERYSGYGPVCWVNSPKGWVDCGMGAASSSVSCAAVVFDQVSSVAMLAVNIATLGATGEAEIAANTAKSGKLMTELTAAYKKIKDLIEKNEKVIEFMKKAATVASTAATARQISILLTSQVSSLNAADIIRITAQIAALFDPTGIAGTVAAYSYPLCSDLKF